MANAQKKRGRPRKKPIEKLEERLDLRVSNAEKTAFKLAAETTQQDLSVWIRVQLHRAASQVLGDIPLPEPNLSEESIVDAK